MLVSFVGIGRVTENCCGMLTESLYRRARFQFAVATHARRSWNSTLEIGCVVDAALPAVTGDLRIRAQWPRARHVAADDFARD
jgi:hypothetical protein